MLENWARIIFKRTDNKKQQDSIELADESTSNIESISGADENQFGGPEKNNAELRSPVIANQPSQSESGGSQSKVQSKNPSVTDEHTSLMQHDENYETVAIQEQAIPDSVRSPNSRQSLTVIDSSINDHHKTKHSELSPTLNTVVNKHFDDDFPAIANSSVHSNKLREQIERNSENSDVTGDAAASEIIRQKILAKQNEFEQLSTNQSDRAPGPVKSAQSMSPNMPESENKESREKGQQLISPGSEDFPVIIKANETGLQQGERSGSSAIEASQIPVAAESRWPILPSETRPMSASQPETTADRWPELPIDSNTTELRNLSAETIRTSKTLVRDMERIRFLEREQKGLLWNA